MTLCSITTAKIIGLVTLLSTLSAPSFAHNNFDKDQSANSNKLELLHEDYPPYIYTSNAEVVGSVAHTATEILERAGYKVKWRKTNYRRLLRELQLSTKPLCAPGYNQSHQQSYGVVASMPFSWFPGMALAIRKSDLGLFNAHKSISDVMSDEKLRGAFLMGANYRGVSADVRAGKVERHILIGSTDVELGLLAARGRVHFAPINPDQINYLVQNNELAANLTVFRPTGMAPPRHVGFICSKATSVYILDRINTSIETLQPYKAQAK